MKGILIAMAVLAVTAGPSFAADGTPPDQRGGMREMMRQHPGMRREMMRDPQHLLMMGYHRNLMTFGRMLEKVARQGETVPREFMRTAVSEMRRSVDEVEKHRAQAMQKMPADAKGQAEMKKMMDQHLVTVKSHLRELENLTKGGTIRSQDVLVHLKPILEGCEGMGCEMMRGHGMHHGGGQMHGGMMMHQHGEMVQKMKAQDAELTRKVELMQEAAPDRKLSLLSDIVSQMVRQHAEMTAHMEQMQKQMSDNGVDDDEDADLDTDYPEEEMQLK